MEEEKKEPFFKRYTIEEGMQEYQRIEEKIEEALAEKVPLDFKKIYLLLEGPRFKELLYLGFTIGKQLNSKLLLITEKTKETEEEANNLSKSMNVDFEFFPEKLDEIEIKEKSIFIVPREIFKEVEKKLKNPILLV
jgi:hypothetical protein